MRRIRAGGLGEVVDPKPPSPSSQTLTELEDDALRLMAEVAKSPTIADSWDDYLRSCEVRGVAPGTLRTYDLVRRQSIEAFGGERRLVTLTVHDVEELLLTWRRRGVGDWSIRGRLTVLKQWLYHADERGAWVRFVPSTIKGPPKPKRKPRVISLVEFAKMLAQWDPTVFEGRRNRVMAMLALDTGARVSEIVGMNVPDVSADRRRIQVLGKGLRERVLAASQAAASELDAWIEFRRDAYRESGLPDDGVLFPATWGRRRNSRGPTATERRWAVLDRDRRMHANVFTCVCRDASKRAGIDPPILPHSLRRTWTTHSLRHGVDVRLLQQQGGWESIVTMEHYLAEATDDDVLAATEVSPIYSVPGAGGGRNRRLGKRRSKQSDG